jgi:hypothetical protein
MQKYLLKNLRQKEAKVKKKLPLLRQFQLESKRKIWL